MLTCECPGCHVNLSLEGCEETEVVKCPKCGMLLEVVSLAPAILEEYDNVPIKWMIKVRTTRIIRFILNIFQSEFYVFITISGKN